MRFFICIIIGLLAACGFTATPINPAQSAGKGANVSTATATQNATNSTTPSSKAATTTAGTKANASAPVKSAAAGTKGNGLRKRNDFGDGYALPSYVRLIDDEYDPDQVTMSDEEFNLVAGRTIFKCNRTELNTQDPFCRELIDSVLPYANAKEWMLVGIDLRGAASPEGPYLNNVRLSVGRAAALREFMSQRLDSVAMSEIATRTVAEDYGYLLWLMRRANDPDADLVESIINRYGLDDPAHIKEDLRNYEWNTLWYRLILTYFPTVRAARVVLYFRPVERVKKVEMPKVKVPQLPVDVVDYEWSPLTPFSYPSFIGERPHMLSVGTNILYDGFYMPNFGWAPMPNVSAEFFPRDSKWTVRAAFMWPYYHRWDKHKFFQIRDYHLEVRRYFNPGFLHTGLYASAYINNVIYGIGISDKKGWQGEGGGGALKLGYVLPLGSGRWRVDFHAAVGYFITRYDPYVWGNPITGEADGKYYYDWTGNKEDFQRRNYIFRWFGPTEIGVTFSYDLLYYRLQKRGVSFLRNEIIE